MNGHSYNSVPAYSPKGAREFTITISSSLQKSMTKAPHNSIVLRNKAGFATNAVIREEFLLLLKSANENNKDAGDSQQS